MKLIKSPVIGLFLGLSLLGACSRNQNLVGKTFFETNQFANSSHLKQSHIIGGEEVLIDDPIAHSTVALYMPNEAPAEGIANFCTGTLVARNIVVTAAHCFKDVSELYLKIPLEEFVTRVRVGFGLNLVKNEHDTQVTFLKLKQVIIHPEYKAGMIRRAKNIPLPDVAILLLDGDAPESAIPAVMSADPELIQAGREITLAGFGVISSGSRKMPKQLMKVNVTIDNPRLTSAQFSYNASSGKSACFADSGGPAYFEINKGEYVLGGITSWGDGYCSKIGVYTSVPAFNQFINESIVRLLK